MFLISERSHFPNQKTLNTLTWKLYEATVSQVIPEHPSN